MGRKRLSKKQMAVIDDLFFTDLDEEAILKKHKVSSALYGKWQSDSCFIAEFERRIAASHRKSQAIIAGYASLAALKLVQLTDCDKEETVRKACLDIISLPQTTVKGPAAVPCETKQAAGKVNLSARTAARLLDALASDECEDR